MKLQVILGSTRQGRYGDRVAKWAVNQVKAAGQTDVELVDLADYPLSFMDEPISPQFNPERAPTPETQKWLDKIAQADGYIIVSPEYNRALPGVLKNALDHVAFEMRDKPVTIVTYGSTGGAQAQATLKIILPAVNAIIMPKSVFVSSFDVMAEFSEDGQLSDKLQSSQMSPSKSLGAALQQLTKYAEALKPLRS